MFPHATCLCVKSARKNQQAFNSDELEPSQHYHHPQQQQQHQNHHNNDKHGKNYERYLRNGYPWIIHRRCDFVEISILSSSQVASILQKSQQQPQLYNRKVGHPPYS